MHKNNLHKNGYNFSALVKSHSPLAKLIIKNPYNNQDTIDFSDSNSVKALNLALLKHHYQINAWDIPFGYLCPPIPGRVDYLHYLHDLIAKVPANVLNKNTPIKALDIGTGASCIYPILGQRVYDWQFTASDIDPRSIEQANNNLAENSNLMNNIDCRLQSDSSKIFTNIIQANEFYHVTLCNPPFHKSLAQASEGSVKKWQKLAKNKQKNNNNANTIAKNTSALNFGGQKAELWCDGGELAFIRRMINESKHFKAQVLWFTCLVSKKDNLSLLKLSLKKANVAHYKVINMTQGQKISRFIAWSFTDF
ncbi:23S rRNA (adenine(1618)-N(6))-methyltransferase RlmF [Colwellia sp. D2M02]|uniref:23S rRNA (adenine(1618)-N(6))-methyltransferase RlmF n=1 Tax=Colwellia sp. D2M02 TaxID=2841562 RepID=UPI001C0A5AA6|nr:23S rRNA (adenine(1618)-N(6))-methyltransferase RlmF [Colwellia sp. D2M02]